MAEHMLMPQFLAQHGIGVLDAIQRRDANFFIPVWSQAGFQFSPVLMYQARNGWRIGIVTFPMPREDTEAYLGVFVAREGEYTLRYFTWERGMEFTAGGARPGTVVGEWSPQGHSNHGAGPAFTGDVVTDTHAITERVLTLV